MTQYNQEITERYAKYISEDPNKRYVQYPGILKLLGRIKGSNVLDVGCGSGILSRKLNYLGSNKIVCYDNSREQIELAREFTPRYLGIDYFNSGPKDIERTLVDFYGKKKVPRFNIAFSNLVLHYAEDMEELLSFFSSTNNLLVEGGKFVGIVTNPNYTRLDEKKYCRRFFRNDKEGNIGVSIGKKSFFYDVNR